MLEPTWSTRSAHRLFGLALLTVHQLVRLVDATNPTLLVLVAHPVVKDGVLIGVDVSVDRIVAAAAALAALRGRIETVLTACLLLPQLFLGAPLLEVGDGRAADAALFGEVGLLLAVADALEDRGPLVFVQVPRLSHGVAK